MEGRIFMTIRDLQELLGVHYDTACKIHLGIRDSLRKKSKYITIKEYCKYEEVDFEEVWNYLRKPKNK